MNDEERMTELREIYELLLKPQPDDDADAVEHAIYKRGFLEGRAFEITTGLDEHPEWWKDRICNCAECQDAVADYR